MYYLCSENKGADQHPHYCEAGLRLCFCIMQIVGFLMRRLKSIHRHHVDEQQLVFDVII